MMYIAILVRTLKLFLKLFCIFHMLWILLLLISYSYIIKIFMHTQMFFKLSNSYLFDHYKHHM